MSNIFENDEESGLGSSKLDRELVLSIPNKTSEEIIQILKDPKNLSGVFNKYKEESVFFQDVFGLGGAYKDIVKNKEIYNKHTPPLWDKIEKELNKNFSQFYERDGIKFPIKTKTNLDIARESSYNPKTKTSIKTLFEPEAISNDKVRLKGQNMSMVKTEVKKVLKNAGIEDYDLISQDKIDENFYKLKKLIKEEVKKVLKENEGGLREELRDEYGDILPKNIVIQILKEHDASIDEYKKDTNFSLNLDKLMDWLGY